MKKKNIVKKLLSIILSAATMFSLLTLPAHAIIPGEDAYSEESHIVSYDYSTGLETPIDVAHHNLYPDTTTYSFLDESELMQVANEVETQTIIDGDDRVQVFPSVAPYSGIVLIITLLDMDGDNVADHFIPGTGFMISEKVMLTARHCVYNDTNNVLEVRVYQGVSVHHSYDGMDIMTYLECLAPYEYDTLVNSIYDTRYANTSGNNRLMYDWNISVLRNGFDCYYFNCSTIYSGLAGATVTVTGYPHFSSPMLSAQSFYMYSGQGTYVSLHNFSTEIAFREEIFFLTADAITGQSGSPVYLNGAQVRTCYGIFVADDANYNWARGITADIYNLIVQMISNT